MERTNGGFAMSKELGIEVTAVGSPREALLSRLHFSGKPSSPLGKTSASSTAMEFYATRANVQEGSQGPPASCVARSPVA